MRWCCTVALSYIFPYSDRGKRQLGTHSSKPLGCATIRLCRISSSCFFVDLLSLVSSPEFSPWFRPQAVDGAAGDNSTKMYVALCFKTDKFSPCDNSTSATMWEALLGTLTTKRAVVIVLVSCGMCSAVQCSAVWGGRLLSGGVRVWNQQIPWSASNNTHVHHLPTYLPFLSFLYSLNRRVL